MYQCVPGIPRASSQTPRARRKHEFVIARERIENADFTDFKAPARILCECFACTIA
jgi:hypothetical protein